MSAGSVAVVNDAAKAEERLVQVKVKALPIDIVPARESLVLEATRVKAAHPLSYADAFARSHNDREGGSFRISLT
jgi:hypothetical protein